MQAPQLLLAGCRNGRNSGVTGGSGLTTATAAKQVSRPASRVASISPVACRRWPGDVGGGGLGGLVPARRAKQALPHILRVSAVSRYQVSMHFAAVRDPRTRPQSRRGIVSACLTKS